MCGSVLSTTIRAYCVLYMWVVVAFGYHYLTCCCARLECTTRSLKILDLLSRRSACVWCLRRCWRRVLRVRWLFISLSEISASPTSTWQRSVSSVTASHLCGEDILLSSCAAVGGTLSWHPASSQLASYSYSLQPHAPQQLFILNGNCMKYFSQICRWSFDL